MCLPSSFQGSNLANKSKCYFSGKTSLVALCQHLVTVGFPLVLDKLCLASDTEFYPHLSSLCCLQLCKSPGILQVQRKCSSRITLKISLNLNNLKTVTVLSFASWLKQLGKGLEQRWCLSWRREQKGTHPFQVPMLSGIFYLRYCSKYLLKVSMDKSESQRDQISY